MSSTTNRYKKKEGTPDSVSTSYNVAATKKQKGKTMTRDSDVNRRKVNDYCSIINIGGGPIRAASPEGGVETIREPVPHCGHPQPHMAVPSEIRVKGLRIRVTVAQRHGTVGTALCLHFRRFNLAHVNRRNRAISMFLLLRFM